MVGKQKGNNIRHFFKFVSELGDGIWYVCIEDVQSIQFTRLAGKEEVDDPNLIGKKMLVDTVKPGYVIRMLGGQVIKIIGEDGASRFNEFLKEMQDQKIIKISGELNASITTE